MAKRNNNSKKKLASAKSFRRKDIEPDDDDFNHDEPFSESPGKARSNWDVSKKKKMIPLPIPKSNPIGRPPKLTDALIDEFERELPRCYYMETVANLLDVDRMTIRYWRKRGRAEYNRLRDDEKAKPNPSERLHLRFYIAMKRGMSIAEKHCVEVILRDISWMSKAWLLERRIPERYGNQAHVIKEILQNQKEMQKLLEKYEAEQRAQNKGSKE